MNTTNEYRIQSAPSVKATNKTSQWDAYELENMNDVNYYTYDQKIMMNNVVKEAKDVEVEGFSEYVYKYIRLHNEEVGSIAMKAEVVSSRPAPELYLVKKTSFGKTGASFKNFTGLQIQTMRITF